MSNFFSFLIPTKRLRLPILVFSLLVFSSFGFLSIASDSFSGKDIFQDSDQDGLTNEEERLYGTDPQKADTDNDGYSDGAEVRSGYDPLKPSPGDKILPREKPVVTSPKNDSQGSSPSSSVSTEETMPGGVGGSDGDNLTQQVSQQIADILKSSSGDTADTSATIQSMQENLQSILDGKNLTGDTELPEVDEKDIKIKKQDYGELSEEEKKTKIKQDTLEYVTKVSYILASNAPEVLNAPEDMEKMATTMMTSALTSIESGNSQYLQDIADKGNRVLLELRDVEVPENMLPIHKKAIQLFQYASTLPKELKSFDSDPLSNIVVLSKMQNLLGALSGFVKEIDSTMKDIGIQDIPVSL